PLRGASQNGTKVHLSGNLIFQGPREQPPADNTVDLLLTGAQHTITAASDFHLFRLTAAADATVAINGEPLTIHLGASRGGGLLLPNGASMNIAGHSLVFRGGATINPQEQTGTVAMTGGDIVFSSTSGQHSFLHLSPEGNRLGRLVVNITGGGV